MKLGLGEKIAAPSARLKWAQNEVKRLALVENELEVIRFHYVDRDAFLCYQDKGLACPYCKQEEYRYRFGVNVILYELVPAADGSGLLVPNGKFLIKMWVFGHNTYEDLLRMKANWGDLTQRDLSVTCTNDQFQNLKVDPLPESLWMSGQCGVKEQVLAVYNSSKKDVSKFLLNSVVLPGQAPRSRRAQPGQAAAGPVQDIAPAAAASVAGAAPLNPPGVASAAPVEQKPPVELANPGGEGKNLSQLMDSL